MDAHKKVQLFLQCNFASTSQIDWRPPLASTPIQEKRNPIRHQSVFMAERRAALFKVPTHVNETKNDTSSLVSKKPSFLSKSKSFKSKNVLASESSSDEEEDFNTVKKQKKLIVRIKNNEPEKSKKPLNNLSKNVASNKKNGKVPLRSKRSNVKGKENLLRVDEEDCPEKNIKPESPKISLENNELVEDEKVDKKVLKGKKLVKKINSEKQKDVKVGKKIVKSKIPIKKIDSKELVDGDELKLVENIIPKRKKPLKKINSEKSEKKIKSKKLEEKMNESLNKSRNSTSHQIFSEIKEQEFLDSVDLTTDEIEPELDQRKADVRSKGRKVNGGKKQEEEIETEEKVDGEEKVEDKIEGEKKVEDKIEGEEKIEEKVAEEKAERIEEDKTEKIEEKHDLTLSDRPSRKRKPPKKFWLPDGEKEKGEEDAVSSSNAAGNGRAKRKKIDDEKADVKDNMEINYFKNIKDLDYRENTSGYFSAECCSLQKFKSGILKLKSNAQASSKTRKKNSAFGGIVLEGSVKMKIGDVEKDIHQGETIFVPPLTEWSAINKSENESVIYYWCGLF